MLVVRLNFLNLQYLKSTMYVHQQAQYSHIQYGLVNLRPLKKVVSIYIGGCIASYKQLFYFSFIIKRMRYKMSRLSHFSSLLLPLIFALFSKFYICAFLFKKSIAYISKLINK